MTTTLTTADIGAFAARRLAGLRELADKQHAAALSMPGSLDAVQCAARIGVWLDDCADSYALSALAGANGDFATDDAIRADISRTSERLIGQASEARRASIPAVPV